MAKIDKSIIIGFTETVGVEEAENAVDLMVSVIENALQKLSGTNSFVSKKFEIVAVNDFYSGAILSSSYMEFLLVVNNPEIQLNTQKLMQNGWKKFTTRLKFAWKNRKKNKKLSRRQKRKLEKQKRGEEEKFLFEKVENYNINHFLVDFSRSLSEFVTTKDVVRRGYSEIVVEGEEIPFKTVIKPVFKKDENVFLQYNPSKNKFFELNLQQHNENLDVLYENYGEVAVNDLIKIFAGLYQTLMDKHPNPMFIESLVANLPHQAFVNESTYENFVFAVNYLVNIKSHNLFSINNPSLKIYADDLCGVNLVDINNFFKKLVLEL